MLAEYEIGGGMICLLAILASAMNGPCSDKLHGTLSVVQEFASGNQGRHGPS